jgi:murein L,D-transpeptidase YcbB/YkuD
MRILIALVAWVFVVSPAVASSAELVTVMREVEVSLYEKLAARPKGDDRKNLASFYAARGYLPVWISDKNLNEQAVVAIGEISQADKYGLASGDYFLPNIRDYAVPNKNMVSAALGVPSDNPGDWLIEAELQLSYAALQYAEDADTGQLNPARISRHMSASEKEFDAVEVMHGLAASSDAAEYLASLHPQFPQFRALVAKLAELRANDDVHIVIPKGPLLKPGASHPHIALVRKRLNISSPVPEKGEDFYDKDMAREIVAWQKSNRLLTDGYIGRQTRKKLNSGSTAKIIDKVLANMERWRWLPDDMGDVHIQVNIPEYKMRVANSGDVLHEERVIVGKPRHKTPIFSDIMETVVFNPYWNVPQSIIWNEMGGVAPAGFESRYRKGRVFIRQPPGPRNALGKVKFVFPNKYSVYMHDTPTKHLFKKDYRAYSHGCMRVRNPQRLAEVVMGLQDNSWSRNKVASYYGSRKNRSVKLDRKIPVHVTYFTVQVDESGKLEMFDDIYGHDRRVKLALNGERLPLERKVRVAVNKKKLRHTPAREKKTNRDTQVSAILNNLSSLFN